MNNTPAPRSAATPPNNNRPAGAVGPRTSQAQRTSAPAHPATPPTPPVQTIADRAAEQERLDEQQFEAHAKSYSVATTSRPALTTEEEAARLRAKFQTAKVATKVLDDLVNQREAYLKLRDGFPAHRSLSPVEWDSAQDFFKTHSSHPLPPEPPPTPPSRLAPPKPAQSSESSADKKASDSGAPVVLKPPVEWATDEIEWMDAEGFAHRTTVYAMTGQAVIAASRSAVKALKGIGAKPRVAVVAAAGAGAGDAAESGTPPVCAIHKTPMVKVKGKKGTFWSCHVKLDDGSWCPYKPAQD